MMQQLRRWQRAAREELASLRLRGQDRALIAACPGAGKTLFTASVIQDDLEAGTIECAVVVVPSRALKLQWKRAVREVGLKAIADLDNGTIEERQRRGMELFDPARPVFIVTYQQVASFPELFQVLVARHKTLAVFDEIHHADDQADFGQALLVAFEDAVFKLSLSGTPFNTKGSKLAFCECDQVVNERGQRINKTRADFIYSYGEALRATGASDDPNVVRPVTFIRWNGYARWEFQNTENGVISERLYDGSRQSDSLAPLLDAELGSLQKMLKAALVELQEIRTHQSNAAMLITAIDSDHCAQIEKLLRAQGINDIVVVMYDTPGAHKAIEAFTYGPQRVLIAIKMISEGVDIKRLRVGIYASDIKTRMFFTQFIGRFIRWDDALDGSQFASVFIPEHVTLIEYAKEIERMVDEAVLPDIGGGDGPKPSTQIVVAKEGDGAMNGAIQHSLFYQREETEELLEWMRRSGVKVDIKVAQALWRNVNGRAPLPDSRPDPQEPDESKANDKLVGKIVTIAKRIGRTDLSFDVVQTLANRHVGIQRKDKLTPIDVLVRRREYLQRLLLSLYERPGRDDVA